MIICYYLFMRRRVNEILIHNIFEFTPIVIKNQYAYAHVVFYNTKSLKTDKRFCNCSITLNNSIELYDKSKRLNHSMLTANDHRF